MNNIDISSKKYSNQIKIFKSNNIKTINDLSKSSKPKMSTETKKIKVSKNNKKKNNNKNIIIKI